MGNDYKHNTNNMDYSTKQFITLIIHEKELKNGN